MPYLETRISRLRRDANNGDGEALNRLNSVRLKPPPEDKLLQLDHGPDKYTYRFKPAPPQFDQVIRYIKLAIRELNKEHMGFAGRNYRVVPTDRSPPFWPPYPELPTYCSKLYTFLDNDNDFPLTAWVTVYPQEAGLATDTLYFKIGTEWVSLKRWLLSKQIPEKKLVGEVGYKVQRKWWKLNGKKFKIMSLPTELRLSIFEHALGPRIYPLSTVDSTECYDDVARENAAVHWGLGFHNCADNWKCRLPLWVFHGNQHIVTGPSACEPNVALLQVSRQVNREASQAGWENTRKCFFSINQFASVLDASRVPNYNWLNKVILDLTMSEWFKFFGVKVHPHLQKDSSDSLGTVLPTLRNLTVLQMWFRSPGDGWRFSPFSDYDTRSPYVCCQRTMVDWIMTFAWPFVKDLPKVILGGAVKRESKLKWDGFLALPTKSKVSVIDQVAEQNVILNTPPELL